MAIVRLVGADDVGLMGATAGTVGAAGEVHACRTSARDRMTTEEECDRERDVASGGQGPKDREDHDADENDEEDPSGARLTFYSRVTHG